MLVAIGVILLLGMAFAVLYNQLTGLHNEVVLAAQGEMKQRLALREKLTTRDLSDHPWDEWMALIEQGIRPDTALPPLPSAPADLREVLARWAASVEHLEDAKRAYEKGCTSFPGAWIARLGRFPAHVLPGGA